MSIIKDASKNFYLIKMKEIDEEIDRLHEERSGRILFISIEEIRLRIVRRFHKHHFKYIE